MKSQLFIPKKIKVGYQHRADTYTKKLAYVIYYDNKGVLRKEKSWRGWIHDKETTQYQWDGKNHTTYKAPALTPDDFDNVPTEGFVLNKKAGGYSTGWNHRQTYCRVWDPRGFEFEISIPNLLFILQETSSFKGKGLEGEFVYAWDGTELVLLPTCCEDYQKCEEFTDIQDGKVSAKELVEGHTYITKRQEKLVYMGKFPWSSKRWVNSKTQPYSGKYVTEARNMFIFQKEDKNFLPLSSISSLAKKVTDVAVTDYADRMDKLSQTRGITNVLKLSSQKKILNLPLVNKDQPSYGYIDGMFFLLRNGVYKGYTIYPQHEYQWINAKHTLTKEKYSLCNTKDLTFENKMLVEDDKYVNNNRYYSREEVEALDFQEVYVELENGRKLKYENYTN